MQWPVLCIVPERLSASTPHAEMLLTLSLLYKVSQIIICRRQTQAQLLPTTLYLYVFNRL